MIYLDNSATTYPKPQGVRQAVQRAFTDYGANPGRSGYGMCLRTTQAVYQVRQQAAEFFGAPGPECVLFQPSCTQALNVVLKGFLKPGDHVVITDLEHNAVTRPLHAVPDLKLRVARSPLFDGEAALEAFEKELDQGADLAICTHVSNVFGFILPVEKIAELCRDRGVPLIIDASQSAGCLPLDFEKLGAAFVAMPGHKGLYGPQGTGLLLCGMDPEPLLQGGTGSESRLQSMPAFLPDRLEAGTHNVAGLAGLLEGLRFVRRRGVENIAAQESMLIRQMGEGLKEVPGARVFLAQNPLEQSGVLSFQLENWDCEDLGDALGDRGFALRAGLHCAPLAHRTAGTLNTGTVRLSFSHWNTREEVDRLLEAVGEIFQ